VFKQECKLRRLQSYYMLLYQASDGKAYTKLTLANLDALTSFGATPVMKPYLNRQGFTASNETHARLTSSIVIANQEDPARMHSGTS